MKLQDGNTVVFSVATIIAWLSATLVAAVGVVVFAYSTFQTREASATAGAGVADVILQGRVAIENRLDEQGQHIIRIETKVDRLLENSRLSK